MTNQTANNSSVPAMIFLIFCLFASVSVGYMFATVTLEHGVAASLEHIDAASAQFPWVGAVMWDITMFVLLVTAWIFYREKSLLRAVLATLGWLGTGSLFLGIYIVVIWLRSRSFKTVLLGKHATGSQA